MSNLASKYRSIAPFTLQDLDTPKDSIASEARIQTSISFKRSTASKTSSLFGNQTLNSGKHKSQTPLKSKSLNSDSKEYFSLPPFKSRSSITSTFQGELKTKSSQFCEDDSASESTTKSLSDIKQPTLCNSKYVFCSNKEFIGLPTFKMQSLISSKPQKVCETKSLAFPKDESFIDSSTKYSFSTKPPTLLESKSEISCSNKEYSSLSPFKSQSSIQSKPLKKLKRKSFLKNNSLSDSTTKSSSSTKQPALLKSKAVICSNKKYLSLPSLKLDSSIVSKHQEVCKTKPLQYSEEEYFTDSTSKSSSCTKDPSANVSTCTSQTKQPSRNVSNCKSQVKSKTDSPYRCKISELRIAKTETRPKMKLSVNSESSNMSITESQSVPKSKCSSFMKESSFHQSSDVFKQISSSVSNKRRKRQQRLALRKIQQGTASVKADATKVNVQEYVKLIHTKKEFVKSQIQMHSCKKVKNVKSMNSSIKSVVRDQQSPPIVDSADHSIKKDFSVTESFAEKVNLVESNIQTKPELRNVSLSLNTNAVVVSILNMNSNCIPGQRIIYDEKKEEQRKRQMSVIKEKQTLLKHKIMQGRLIQSQNAKDVFIMQAKSIQTEIDTNFQKLDELGKMPNYPKQKTLVKPKLKKVECINSLHSLLQHLAGKIVNEVNIETIHQFINFEIVEEAFDDFLVIKKQHLKKIEAAKQKMNLNLQNLLDFLKLNRDIFTCNASFPRMNTTEDISSLCESLQKNLQINLRHLISFCLLASNFLKSVQNFRLAEKFLFDEWNKFIFIDHKNFFTLKKIR